MLILIAESKTMKPLDGRIAPGALDGHRPALDAEAGGLMESLGDMTAARLSEAVKISLPMAQRLHAMIYDFPNKAAGGKAIDAFTGVVFKAFDYPSLTTAERSETVRRVRIISSLYGWLRPDDIIKPYRFDFTTPLAPGGKTFAAWWRDRVTRCLTDELAATGETDILNLMPADAARMIDWKAVEKTARVWKADFREIVPAADDRGTVTRTPRANRLKTLRGTLLRQIITERITSADALTGLSSDDYIAEKPAPDSPLTVPFITA